MARVILITRRDWLQETGVSFRSDVGFWDLPLTNLLDQNPQVVARCVDNRDPAAPIFAGDLGQSRYCGFFGFAALRTTSMGLMRFQAGVDSTFATNTFDSGILPSWPVDSVAGEYDAWGRWTLNGVYNEDEYLALGMPRCLIPSQRVLVRYFRATFADPTARVGDPLTIGCFGCYDVWEPPINFKFDWDYTQVDESTITRVPRGSSFIDEGGIRRRLNLGFDQVDEDEFWARGFGTILRAGRSIPLWVIPFSDSGQITRWEKAAIYGLVSTDSVMSNPLVGRWAVPVTIEQLI